MISWNMQVVAFQMLVFSWYAQRQVAFSLTWGPLERHMSKNDSRATEERMAASTKISDMERRDVLRTINNIIHAGTDPEITLSGTFSGILQSIIQ